jgi:hypothetical protein
MSGPVDTTALASFPRSGNTWLRSMIEQASGRSCGSVYDDRIMPRPRTGIVIKTHELDRDRYTRAIHMVRDPFDTVESYFHWRREIGGETTLAWDDHLQETVPRWAAHTRHWLEATCPVHRLRYEDLHADTAGQLQETLRWLGIEIPASRCREVAEASSLEAMRRRAPADLGDRFFRRGLIGHGPAAFTPSQRHHLADVVSEVARRVGYVDLDAARGSTA